MATSSGLMFYCSGIRTPSLCASNPKLPFRNLDCKLQRFNRVHKKDVSFSKRNLHIPNQYFHQSSCATNVVSGRSNYPLNYSENSQTESFWLNLIREAVWSVRNLSIFLAEQPSQLKYIEWPSFQDTLKTAILTLILVALLIVALWSVDSSLSYIMALVLRRKA